MMPGLHAATEKVDLSAAPLHHKVALITGASQGLGLAIARKYLAAGANVVICARDATLLAEAARQLAALASKEQAVLGVPADVSREKDIAVLCAAAVERFGRIDVLVNNAGVHGPTGRIEELDWGEWVRTIEINLLGSVLACRAALPHLKQTRRGKIIQLSGGGATSPMPGISAYAASKAAVIRFTETLAEELRELSIDVNAIAPGALNTRMLDQILQAGPDKVGADYYERAREQQKSGGAPLATAADLAVWLGSSASDGITGKLISAVWDPWESLAEHRHELNGSDVYTLRRIVPADRGMSWGSRP
jgi:NAD(P)-dependent dehydrogenase (short-subunit alcohol dehydrogenase family)